MFARAAGMRSVAVYGGAPKGPQIRDLHSGAQVGGRRLGGGGGEEELARSSSQLPGGMYGIARDSCDHTVCNTPGTGIQLTSLETLKQTLFLTPMKTPQSTPQPQHAKTQIVIATPGRLNDLLVFQVGFDLMLRDGGLSSIRPHP